MTSDSKEKLFKKEYAHELLKIAKGDLQSATVLSKQKMGRPENICLLAQQTIEKAIKAVLAWKQIPFPLVHDAGVLIAKLPTNELPPYGYALSELTQFATVRRYEEGSYELSEEEIASVLKSAEDVLGWAIKKVQ